MNIQGRIAEAAAPLGLMVMGLAPDGGGTLVLLGTGPGFWPVFAASPEYSDGRPHPLDRWSARVIGALAQAVSARCVFPFGGPPFAPFVRYALDSGQSWQSPVGMLVHSSAGLMISFRGALRIDAQPAPPSSARDPCTGCAAPCRTACPVDALGPQGYDVAACKAFLETGPGADCMARGCKARRACPVSQSFGRDPAQSAFHMAAFHPCAAR